MARHIDVENASPIMPNDEEDVQHVERQRRYGEEVHSGNRFPVIS
jgi:hypothetical protein